MTASELIALADCPFCGGKADIREGANCHDTWFARCIACGCKTLTSYTKKECAEAWNARLASSPSNEATRVALRDVLDHGLIYWEPNTKRGHVEKALMIARCEKLLAARAAIAPDSTRELFDDILSRVAVFRDHEPEEDETWESWYFAAFDLLLSEIKEMRKTALSVPVQPEAQMNSPSEAPSTHGKPDGAVQVLSRDWKTVKEQIGAAQGNDLLALLRDYLVINSSPGNDLAPLYIARINAALAREDKIGAAETGPGDVVAMKEALKPFAKLAEWGDGKHLHFPQPGVSQEIDGMFVNRPDDRVILKLAPGCPTITLGDLRRARAAIDAVSGAHTTPSTAMNKQQIVDFTAALRAQQESTDA